ncbi:MAG: hypothetical protein ACLQPH_07485 [Acidimicrobiales bacterium]
MSGRSFLRRRWAAIVIVVIVVAAVLRAASRSIPAGTSPAIGGDTWPPVPTKPGRVG